jgi:hypothetical protein
VSRIRDLWAWLDTNPYTSLWMPPGVFFLQFFVLLALIKSGFPENAPQQEVQVSVLLIGLFGLTGICLAGMILGVRQVLILESKIFPLVGILLNALYLAGFTFFFLFVLVLQNLT